MNKKPNFYLSTETRQCKERLKQAEIGETVTYKELSDLIGRDIQEYRNPLSSARHALIRDHGIDFCCITGVGVRRLSDKEVVLSADYARKKIRKTSNREMKRLMNCVENFEALPVDLQKKHNSEISAFLAMRHFTKESSLRKIQDKIGGDVKRYLPTESTMALFTPKVTKDKIQKALFQALDQDDEMTD